MSIFVILGLLVCIEAQGSSDVTTVFVKKGDDLILNVGADNLQEADSGVYAARVVTLLEEQPLAEYKVTVQGPVSPVELTVDSVDSVFSRGSDSCNLTVTCSTQHSHISSTFRCVSRTCSQEGGERPELTTSGASLHVYLMYGAIICNHSNQVNWTKDFKMTEHLCPQYAGPSAGTSVYLVKMVVFSVGLIIMVFAVITVHLMEKFRKHK
ncbi:hypothetical protein VZT92_003667 [Zoarces viviparus]|uniref:Uncharacterized protein n=1 Tax=Zoarces viviparus TaxID=48416 RepID=A0AAW1FUV8_ZOAVI